MRNSCAGIQVFAFLAIFSVSCLHAAAQSAVSQISGVVKDGTGAIVPEAEVQIKNTDTNIVHSVQSNGAGEYTIPSLPIGHYQLQVKKQGFSTFVQDGITLEVNSNPEINVALQVGLVTEQIEVQANASMVESHDTAVSQVINPEQIVDFPLNGREPTDLIALSGAAVNTNGAGGAINTLDYPSAVSYSVAGSQANATNYYLDGAQNLDFRTNVGLPMPFPDALAEFNLGISAMPANLGAHPGGAVNGVTRSGGNAFHGSAFEFVRNGILDATARTYAAASGAYAAGVRDTLVRNQFGGTIGGPIKRDKMFFFAGYQGTLATSTPGGLTTTVPTTNMRNGDFSQYFAVGSGCSGASTATKNVYLNPAFTTTPTSNMIQPALLQTPSAILAAKVAALMPTNTIDACGDIAYIPGPTVTAEHQGVGRIDWQRTAKDSIFARYYFTHYTQPTEWTPGNILSISTGGVGLADFIQEVAAGDTYTLGAHGINTLRLAATRSATVRASNPGIPTLCSLGMNATCPVANQLSAYKAAPGNLGYDFENTWAASESYAWTNGKHQINMGFTFTNVQMNNDGVFQENPGPTFTATTTGLALADFITGNVDSYSQGNGQLGRDGQKQYSAYIQDAWKVLPTFQITAGLRWDPFIPQHNKYKEEADFSLLGYTLGQQSTVYPGAPPGMTFPGDAGFNGRSPTTTHLNEFAPRVGFVWDVTGKGTQTLRAGYGIFFDTTILWNTMHIVLDPPWGETLSFTPATVAQGGGLANPFFGQVGGNPFPTPLNPPSTFVFPTNGTYIFENQSNRPTITQQYNLAYQAQVGKNLKLSASYIGNTTDHIWLGLSQNAAQYLPQYGTTLPCTLQFGTQMYTFNPCNAPSQKPQTFGGNITDVNARRALTLLNPVVGPLLTGGLTTEFSGSSAAYNGLLVSAQQRMSHGLSVLANYTWSHCMDQGEVGQDIGNSAQNPANPKAEWGNCGYNRKAIVNLSVIAQTPRFENRALRDVASKWSASGIFTVSTGSNFNLTDAYDYSLSAVGSDRPNVVGNWRQSGAISANPGCTINPTVHTLRYWFNPCAFAPAAFGTFGNEHRNDLVGPANWNLNFALWRTFSLPERLSMDIRAEGFNILNHAEIGNPSTTTLLTGTPPVYNTATGIITGSATQGPRIMQLAVKLAF
jgi:hypothetical protein